MTRRAIATRLPFTKCAHDACPDRATTCITIVGTPVRSTATWCDRHAATVIAEIEGEGQ